MNAGESANDAPPPERVPEAAARSLANGLSVAAVARWFDVPEADLLELISESGDQTAPGPAVAEKVAEKVESEPEKPARARPRPAPVRSRPYVYPAPAADDTRRRPGPASPGGVRDFLQVLRRRLLLLVVGLILGASAGWVTAPGETRHPTTFEATHTVIFEPQGGQTYNIEQVALLATSGEVPSRVAARLRLDRGEVRAAVSAEAQADVATISITSRASSADRAVSLADVTAEELVVEIDGSVQSKQRAEVARLSAQVETARNRLSTAKTPAAQAAARTEITAADEALQQYQAKLVPSQLRTLEGASPSAVNTSGVRTPDSQPVRAALLGAIGLLAGIAGAFVLDRLDSRIRCKSTAEDAFGVPVVAEVPPISKAVQGQLLARTQPSSPFVEAYRGLRTYVALWAPDAEEEDGHRVLVVTSPSPGEGKTTTVAHLAAMLAEIGRSVVVISADLRRPRVHQYFDLPSGPGIVEALGARPGRPVFTGLDKATSIRGVRLVPSGPAVENPAPLFEYAGDLVHAVRGSADFVLIDAPPLLVANDAVEMARHADGVILVARAGETPIEAAERSAEILERLEIPVVGSVLVASEAASSASRYYASRYYTEPEEKTRWLRRRSAGAGHGPAPQAPPSPSE